MLGYMSLESLYRLNFSLLQHFKYSLADIDNLIPYERDLYLDFLAKYIQEENDRLK
jgi:hypothetical protein